MAEKNVSDNSKKPVESRLEALEEDLLVKEAIIKEQAIAIQDLR